MAIDSESPWKTKTDGEHECYAPIMTPDSHVPLDDPFGHEVVKVTGEFHVCAVVPEMVPVEVTNDSCPTFHT